MKRQAVVFASLLFLVTMTAYGQGGPTSGNTILGQNIAAAFGQWRMNSINSVGTGSQSMLFQPSSCSQPWVFIPLSTTAPVTVTDPSGSSEMVTPSGVTFNGSVCSFTATFGSAHAAGAQVTSGSHGLQEAINAFTSGQSGSVIVTPGSFITTGMITAATGSTSVGIVDLSGQGPVYYGWNGSAYAQVLNVGATSVTGAITATAAPVFPVLSETTTYTALGADFAGCKVISAPSGTFTVTLVAVGSQPANGTCVWVINYGSGTVTVAPNGQNINGAGTSLTLTNGQGAFIQSDGANYVAQSFGTGTGGATLPAGAIVYGLSSTISRAATATDVAGLGALTNNTSGNAATATNLASILAANVVRKDAANTMGAFLTDFSAATLKFPGNATTVTGSQGNGATLQFSTGATTANDCVKFDANGNTVDAGSACGSGGGTVTSSGSPVSGNIPKFTTSTNIAPAAASDIVNLFSTCSGTQYLGADGACHAVAAGGAKTIAINLGAGQGAGGCSLAWNFLSATAPTCLLTAGSSTQPQFATPQFTVAGAIGTGTALYIGPLIIPSNYTMNGNLTINLGIACPVSTSGSVTFKARYADITNPAAVQPTFFTTDYSTAAVTVSGTINNSVTGSIMLTPNTSGSPTVTAGDQLFFVIYLQASVTAVNPYISQMYLSY